MTGIGPVRRPPAACARSRGGRNRSRPYPALSVDPAALHAPVEVDRDAAAYPLPEGDLDGRPLRGAGSAARQGGCRVAGIRHRPPEGRLAWQKRDLSAKREVYIRTDGIHLQARLEDEKQLVVALIGVTPEGRRELVGFTDAARESAHDCRELLLDLKRRGLDVPPRLAIADGALGFWKAAGAGAASTRSSPSPPTVSP